MMQSLEIKKLQNKVEDELIKLIPKLGEPSKLRDACEYVLLSGGKRVRPLIVYMMAKAMGNKCDVTDAALAVEFFHSASLIADDLPCMDNEENRRDKPCVHKVFGESVAVLASYTLISLGYEFIYRNAKKMEEKKLPFAEKAGLLALKTVSELAGIFGATNGQFLDLYPPDSSIATMQKIIEQKTITLFEISFVLGWLFGGGDLEKIDDIKKLSYHFGMAFQIGDDLQDLSQDHNNEEINIASELGFDKTLDLYKNELNSYQKMLVELSLDQSLLSYLGEVLEKKAALLFKREERFIDL